MKKIADSRLKKIDKLDSQYEQAKTANAGDDDAVTAIERKKQKNLEKVFKYQQRTNKRTFKQREPVIHDHLGANKRQK